MSYRIFENVKLVGVSGVVPSFSKSNEEIYQNNIEIKNTAEAIGVKSRYICSENTCASDLCFTAAEQLLNKIEWERDSVDALIFLSQTPDYLLPSTSCILQKKLNLSTNCAAFDVSLGCSGYIYGLLLAYSLISETGIRRVLLLVGDTVSKIISPYDIPSNILFGDAGTASAIEFDEKNSNSFISVGTDGEGFDSLIVEAGGFRKKKSKHTSVRYLNKKDKILRSAEELFMDGPKVFDFALSRVPTLVRNILSLSKFEIEDVDYWLFHQANKFMLDHFMNKLGISSEKFLVNIDNFGNTSPPSIPLLMVSENLSKYSQNQKLKICLVGFGVGFSWGAALLEVENLITPSLKLLAEDSTC